ncbi:MAG TPA: NAD(P)H-dependent oxidoreductase subunit E [Methanothrix sp.]|nr:NAD(P)H-dependent oxidoreductase subunit E [Methanothrix sp.]
MKEQVADEEMEERTRAILEGFSEREGALIPLLQRVQSRLGYISPEAITAISEVLELSESEIYGVATFYAEFRLAKPGCHQIKVCMGTSCYLRGARELLEHVSRRLAVRPGRTRGDGKFSLETVACLGCCSRSPVMAVDGVTYGDLSPEEADEILANLESEVSETP